MPNCLLILLLALASSLSSLAKAELIPQGPNDAKELLDYVYTTPGYKDRAYWRFAGGRWGGSWDHLTGAQKKKVFGDLLEDVAALVKPHWNDQCDIFFRPSKGGSVTLEQQTSSMLAVFGGLYSLDPHVGSVWIDMVMALDEIHWWNFKTKRENRKVGEQWNKTCYDGSSTVLQALESIVTGPIGIKAINEEDMGR